MADFVAKQRTKTDGPDSWSMDVLEVNKETWDLTVRNPHTSAEAETRTPEAILAEIAALDAETARVLDRVRALL